MNEYFHFPLPLSRHFSTFPSLPFWITTDIAIDLCRKQKDNEDRPLQYKTTICNFQADALRITTFTERCAQLEHHPFPLHYVM
jgi:hypothetical protein